jgi:pyrimidine operon attenuation protein/uracil phosphoribosyltransferase
MTALADPQQLLERMAADLTGELEKRQARDALMVGIHTGGLWVASRLHDMLGLDSPLGSLDISFYRDDFTRIGMNPRVRPSQLPVSLEGRHVLLVDDVLYTGRTVRAALNELFDYGRPASVLLSVLVDRGGRELPVCATVTGTTVELAAGQQVKLTGPSPLQLRLIEA